MNRARWLLVGLVTMSALATAAAARASLVSVDLGLSPPENNVNRLDVTVAISGVGSDSDVATASGNLPADLWIDFDPRTQEAAVTGIAFQQRTPGTVSFSDVHLRYLLGTARIDSSGVKATVRTPIPPGPVDGDSFNMVDHTLVLNFGTFKAVFPLTPDITVDLAANPLEATTDAMGDIAVSSPTVVDGLATYNVRLSLPVDFNEVVLQEPQDPATASLAIFGRLQATGQFTRVIPPPPPSVLSWDGTGDGLWSATDRWDNPPGTPARHAPDGGDMARVRANTVTADGANAARSLTIAEGGTLAIPAGTSVTAGQYATIDTATGGALSIGLADSAGGVLSAGGTANLGGTLSLSATAASFPSVALYTETIVTGTVNGTFNAEPAADEHLGGGVFFKSIAYNPSDVSVDLLQAISGDANGDRAFNFADLVQMFSASGAIYGNPAPPAPTPDWTGGDFTGDSAFTFADLVKAFGDAGAHYGAPSYPAAALAAPDGAALSAMLSQRDLLAERTVTGALLGGGTIEDVSPNVVPEPGTLVMLIGGLFGLVLVWRRKRRRKRGTSLISSAEPGERLDATVSQGP